MIDEAAGDKEKKQLDQIKLNRLNQEYERFSKAAKLKTQYERTEVAGFGEKNAVEKNSQSAILSDKDIYAINQYKSARSYSINAALRGEIPMTGETEQIVQDIDAALEKLPTYQGTVYRSVTSGMMEDVDGFLRKYKPDATVVEAAYTSSGSVIYDPGMDIQLVIESKRGRDLREYNPNEQEIVFRRGTRFHVLRVEGKTIYSKRCKQLHLQIQEMRLYFLAERRERSQCLRESIRQMLPNCLPKDSR